MPPSNHIVRRWGTGYDMGNMKLLRTEGGSRNEIHINRNGRRRKYEKAYFFIPSAEKAPYAVLDILSNRC
jgi:hypothetical protein